MKKSLLVLILILSYTYSFAESALLLKKGWQLIGSTSKISDMHIFDTKSVEQVWHYDAPTQKWEGYSPDISISQKIKEKGYTTLSELQSWHGFWIKSKKEWALTLPTDQSPSDENITLYKGWNLISLPVDTVVSPHLFDGKTVWKYALNDQWQLFDIESKENFPAISHISNSDGIWVKSDQKQTISTISNAAKLHNFTSVDMMKSYIRDMLLTHRRPFCGYYPLTNIRSGLENDLGYAPEAGDNTSAKGQQESSTQGAASNTSETNLQETGVDESDIIKHNSKNIFYLYHREENDSTKIKIGVTTFESITNDKLTPLYSITPAGIVIDLYLSGDKLITLSRANEVSQKPSEPILQEKVSMPYYGSNNPNLLVEIYNVADISNIQKEQQYTIDGSLNSSRIIDGKLYLISQFNPYIKFTYPSIYVDAPECKTYFFHDNDTPSVPTESTPVKEFKSIFAENYTKYARCYTLQVDKNNKFYREDYDNPTISYENLIPYFQTNNNEKQMLITPTTFYASDKKNQEPVITTISQIDISTGKLEKTTSVLGYSNTVYASQKAIYLVSNLYPLFYGFDRYEERSALYRFKLGENLAYDAFGFVKGRILNQFSLSEYNDILRIATTEGNSWQGDTNNALYTLKPIQNALLIQGVLSGLGEQGETIRSVRFMGDRGYIVTFRQTDPFYTLDLSNPTQPKKVGTLKVDGFSSYLHPISHNLILGFGRDATPDGQTLGLKMELFNVENFANPISVDSYTIPGNYSWSEVEYNHKALAYRPDDHLMAFAYSMYDYNHHDQEYLGIYQITDQKIDVYTPIPNSSASRYRGYQRGLIFDMNGQTYIAFFANGNITYRTLATLTKER